MRQILLLIQQRGNRQLLRDWLSRNYEVTIGSSIGDLDQSFDLAILDAPMLGTLRGKLLQRKSSELPVYLPLLLITSHQETGALTRNVLSVVDELIQAPIDPIELQARVDVLLRVRDDSLSLKRHNDALELFIADLTGAFEVAEDETQLTEILLDHALRIGECDSGGVIVLEEGEARVASLRGTGLQRLDPASNLKRVIEEAGKHGQSTLSGFTEAPTGLEEVVIPILIRDQVAGAVVLGKGITDQDDSERRLLRSLCAQAGVFLHNLRQAHRLVEAAQLYHQVEQAETVQRQLLPVPKDGIKGLETAAFYRASNRVGGDYYDVIEMGPGRVAAVISDVAGHSLSSGLVMTAARSAFRVLLQRERSPAKVIEQLNGVLYPDLEQTGVFITMCLVVVDLEIMTATYANAGHCPPMIFRQGQEPPVSLEATGVPIGILPDADYSEARISVLPGDTVVLYTDGITEARNSDGQLWGEEGLVQCVQNHARIDPESTSRAVVEGALRHSNHNLDDDLTVLVLKMKDDRLE